MAFSTAAARAMPHAPAASAHSARGEVGSTTGRARACSRDGARPAHLRSGRGRSLTRIQARPEVKADAIKFMKDGKVFEISEDDVPAEDLLFWEETGREVANTNLWDLVKTDSSDKGYPLGAREPEAAAAAEARPVTPSQAYAGRQRLQISKMDFTVNSIIDKINRGKVNLRPSYQREYVWTTRTASRLIESLLLNVPIPTMFFHETEGGNMEVVDGKQRLTSIWAFMMGEFPDGTSFKLTGLEVFEDLNGLTFRDLTEMQQECIKDYALNVHIISKQSQPDFVFEVFERLNMGATQLNEQELRNCIYQGAYTDLLGRLAANEHLLKVYKSTQPHLRMRDRELILRFFAMLRSGPEGFRSPVKGWLNEEIRDHRDLSAQEIAALRGAFEQAIYLAWEVFGDCAFRPVKAKSEWTDNGAGRFETGEVNVAIWDTLMFSLAQYRPEELLPHKELVQEAFVELAGDEKFRKLLVSQPKAVVARAAAWSRMLASVLQKAPGAGAAQ